MTIKQYKKACEINKKLNIINKVLNDEGTALKDNVAYYSLAECVTEVVKEKIIEFLKNKRIELQNKFNNL